MPKMAGQFKFCLQNSVDTLVHCTSHCFRDTLTAVPCKGYSQTGTHAACPDSRRTPAVTANTPCPRISKHLRLCPLSFVQCMLRLQQQPLQMRRRWHPPCKGRCPQAQITLRPRGDSAEDVTESASTAPPWRGCKPHLRCSGSRARRFTAVPLRSRRRGQGRSCRWARPAGVTWVLLSRRCSRRSAGQAAICF